MYNLTVKNIFKLIIYFILFYFEPFEPMRGKSLCHTASQNKTNYLSNNSLISVIVKVEVNEIFNIIQNIGNKFFQVF